MSGIKFVILSFMSSSKIIEIELDTVMPRWNFSFFLIAFSLPYTCYDPLIPFFCRFLMEREREREMMMMIFIPRDENNTPKGIMTAFHSFQK